MIDPDLLRRQHFFAGFTAAEIDAIAEVAKEERIAEGTVLFREGDAADRMYFVIEGELETLISDDAGRDIAVSSLPHGEVAGWSAVIEPYAYTSTVRAAQPARVLVFERTALARGLSNLHLSALLMQRIAETISRRLRWTQAQLLRAR